jgi:hypothetical protein
MSFDRQSQLYNEAPTSATDLCVYQEIVVPQKAINNGRVNPKRYGSIHDKDLGLCQDTFLEKTACRRGVRCPWRHRALVLEERDWIEKLEGGARFLEKADSKYASGGISVASSFREVMEL